MALLKIDNLNITHKNTPLVKNISLTVNAAKTTCIIGESGSGKTLTALSIMGLLPPTLTVNGNFCLNDKKIDSTQIKNLRGNEVSMIFQEPLTALNPVISIGKQIEEVFILHTKFSKNERKKKVLSLLKKVCLPNPKTIINAYPSQLSGGQRQRVMIAMALALKPNLLIADEPTTALDVTTQAEILELLKNIQQEMGMAILFITHDFAVVKNIADNVLVMNNGEIVEQGTLKGIFNRPKQAYTKQLLAATPKLTTAKKIAIQKNEPLLEITNIHNSFTAHQKNIFSLFPKKVPVLKNVSFTLYKGETIGIVGESGCGKSTLSKCILNIHTPSSGVIAFNGEDIQKDIPELRKHVQMVFQDPFSSLNPRMYIGDSIAEGVRAHNIFPEIKIRDYVESLLRQCGLPSDSFYRYPHNFSGGQRQRICIARALAMKPDIIIADEAVSALDVSIQKQILELLNDLKQKHNLSYIFISHDLRVISQISDKVLVMHKGKIVEHGTVHKVFTNPKHSYTKKLLSSVT